MGSPSSCRVTVAQFFCARSLEKEVSSDSLAGRSEPSFGPTFGQSSTRKGSQMADLTTKNH